MASTREKIRDILTETPYIEIMYNIDDAVDYLIDKGVTISEQPTADVVSMEAYKQVCWELDVAIEQLQSYGVGFAEKKELEEVRHGEWIPVQYTYFGLKRYECSECKDDEYWQKRYLEHKEKYCPNCGAKMDGGKVE